MIYKGLRVHCYKVADPERRWAVQKPQGEGWEELHRCKTKAEAITWSDAYLYERTFLEAQA